MIDRRIVLRWPKNSGLWQNAVVLLLCYKALNLIALPGSFGSSTNELLVMGASVLLLCFYILQFGLKNVMRYDGTNFLLWIYFFIFVEVLFTLVRYPQESVSDTLREASTYLTLLSYYVFKRCARWNRDRFLSLLIDIAILSAFLYIVNALMYNTTGQFFLQVYGFNYGILKDVTRSDTVRLVGPALIDFTTYIAIGILFSKNVVEKLKIRCAVLVVVGCIYNIYVSQTRSTLAIMAAITVVILLKSSNKNALMKIILASASILLFLIMIFSLKDMFQYSSTDYSIYHRLEAVNFYLNRFRESPIFGNGLLRDDPATAINKYLVHGSSGYTYIDVGVIGFIGHFGLLGLLSYGYLIALAYRNVKRGGETDMLALSILLACLASMVNLSLFDAGRISTLAVYLALMGRDVKNVSGR